VSKLKKVEVNEKYQSLCQLIAQELKNDFDSDYGDYVDQIAKDKIETIQNRGFLTETEKTIRDYFLVNNFPLDHETLASDIFKYL